MVPEKLKTKSAVNKAIPIVRRARTKNLAFLFNLAAHVLQKHPELVVCINFNTNTYILSLNEIQQLKKLYGNWLLAYIKGFTNERPTFKALAAKTGYSLSQVSNALNNKPSFGYTLTYDILKEWGYIYEY